MNPLLEAALEYRFKYNWSVIPLSPNSKIPPKGFNVVQFRERFADKEEIEKWWSENPRYNIAVITGKLSNLFIVDLDKYKPEYNEEKFLEYFGDSLYVPTETTPRGGQHLLFSYPDEDNPTIHADTLPGIDYRGDGGYAMLSPSVFEGKSGKWIIPPNGKDLPAPPPQFIDLLKSINKSTLYTEDKNNSRQMSSLSSNVFIEGRRDQDIFHLASLLVKGGCEPDFLDQVLNIAAQSCNPPFPENEVKLKIQSAIQRAERKERNLTAEITEWVLSSSGQFLSSEVAKCLHLSSRDDQKHLSTVLKRLSTGKEIIIEKVGNKHGCFKLIDKDEELIDWENADITPLDIKFPLGVHEKVRVHKGNIIVIAGESNAGKTAYCLNMAAMNVGVLPINYMSSEMKDGAELAIRINEFKVSKDIWRMVKFTFRVDGFPEKIKPEAINIIDYLDEGTDSEAYKMPMRLRQIADKLTTGIAIVAIQKDPNKVYGFGGSGTMNRSRVYLTIRRNGTIKIEKAKIWRDKHDNPNGKALCFKLVAGSVFTADGNWTRED